MDLIMVRCTNCGAKIENVRADQTVFHCPRIGCGARFVVEQAKKFSEVDDLHSEQIARLRVALRQNLEHYDPDAVDLYAGEIASLIPEDFRARAALSLVQARKGHPASLRALLETRQSCCEEEFEEFFACALELLEYRELGWLLEAVPLYVSDKARQRELQQQVRDRRAELRRRQDDYADVPRSVFICHSSRQRDIAERVADALTRDGELCWISTRNLPPRAANYWEAIERAINRCKVILVIASEDAMVSPDVQKELALAEKAGLGRLELKVDDVPHTTYFKYFFDGLSWVRLGDSLDEAIASLQERLYVLLHGAPETSDIPEVEAAPAGESEQAREAESLPQEAAEPEPIEIVLPGEAEGIELSAEAPAGNSYRIDASIDPKLIKEQLKIDKKAHPEHADMIKREGKRAVEQAKIARKVAEIERRARERAALERLQKEEEKPLEAPQPPSTPVSEAEAVQEKTLSQMEAPEVPAASAPAAGQAVVIPGTQQAPRVRMGVAGWIWFSVYTIVFLLLTLRDEGQLYMEATSYVLMLPPILSMFWIFAKSPKVFPKIAGCLILGEATIESLIAAAGAPLQDAYYLSGSFHDTWQSLTIIRFFVLFLAACTAIRCYIKPPERERGK